ncbi:MAG: hypothetical protein HGA65_18810 [Oscillochloris sp.]|nr:hypothetical protein [Oscillochloris sp.]
MDILIAVLRYGLVTAVVVEVVLVGRALFTLATEKARPAAATAPAAEE